MSDLYSLVLAILKGLGLLMAGVFGLIGATTNFKGEDKKLTYWGKWNLAALTFGLFLSMTVQILEYRRGQIDASSAATKAKDAALKTEKILARTTEAAEKIGDVAEKIVKLSTRAKESALKISAVQANVERGLDPIEPLRVTSDIGPDPMSLYDDNNMGSRPFDGELRLWFLEQTVLEDHITWPNGTRSLWDLLGEANGCQG